MNMTIKQLESAAIEAHQAGTTWFAFWPTIAAELLQLDRGDDRPYANLVRRLVAIVASGDTDGMQPIGQWDFDDDQAIGLVDADGRRHPGREGGTSADDFQEVIKDFLPVPVISDTDTAAHCLWSPGQQDFESREESSFSR